MKLVLSFLLLIPLPCRKIKSFTHQLKKRNREKFFKNIIYKENCQLWQKKHIFIQFTLHRPRLSLISNFTNLIRENGHQSAFSAPTHQMIVQPGDEKIFLY